MLKMVENKVAIIPIRDPEKSAGGIWIPEEAKERVDQGIVQEVGPKCEIVNAGDYVLFPGYSGKLISVEGEGTFIIMAETDIVAKLHDGDVPDTEVPGLYFKGTSGTYFPATVEHALAFIAKALEEAPWRARFKSTQRIFT